MTNYKKFQFGWLITLFFGLIIIFLSLCHFYQWGNKPLPFEGFIGFVIFFLVILLQFYGNTIIVNDNQIILKIGIGIIKKKFDLSSIKSVEIIKLPFWAGYGIRYTGSGYLYNVSGRMAIELKFKARSSMVQIGSDDCENLKNNIDSKIKKFSG